ncbi:MAG TPA: META domain-containing protein [Patescibacteria group bacterium]|nr:META domain-containing protein [Patescibacteria group bacterium]
MIRHFLTAATFAVLALASSCKHLPVDPPIDPRDTTHTPIGHMLTGTSWKLHGLAVKGGQIQIADRETFTLKFTTASHAEGSASCNGYGADVKADSENISFSNIISTMAYCGDESLDRHFMPALQSAHAYTRDGNSLIIFSKSGITLYFYSAENPQQSHHNMVKFADFQLVKFHIDPFHDQGVRKVDENHIALTVGYSGGCREHDFELYADEPIMPGNATDFAKLMLTHNAHGDVCEAYLTKELIFNVEPLLRKWRNTPHANQRLVLQFSQFDSGVIEFHK